MSEEMNPEYGNGGLYPFIEISYPDEAEVFMDPQIEARSSGIWSGVARWLGSEQPPSEES